MEKTRKERRDLAPSIFVGVSNRLVFFPKPESFFIMLS